MLRSERIKCFTVMGGPPKFKGRHPSNASSHIRGRLQLLKSHFSRILPLEAGAGTHIRGHSIAPESLLQALLENGTCTDLAFVTGEEAVTRLNDWARSTHYDVEVYSTSRLLESGLDAFSPDLWLDLTGKCDGLMRIRDRRSSHAFPIVSLQHGVSNEKYLYDVFARLLLSPTYSCDSVICTSNSCKRAVSSILDYISEGLYKDFGAHVKFNGRLDVLPLCVDTELLVPIDKQVARKKLGIASKSTVILYVGYLSLVKADVVQVLPMLRSLVEDNPAADIQIILAGTGPHSYITYLKSAIQTLGLASRITIYLQISDNTKHLLLSSADIFFAPCESLQESFGLTPIEAMSCGLPQVVASWDGYRETVRHGETGFLVPTRWAKCDSGLGASDELIGWHYAHTILSQSAYLDCASMQKYLQLLVNNIDLRSKFSIRSREVAISEYSFRRVAVRYEELFRELGSIAQELAPETRSARFDEAQYYNCFGHFSDDELTRDTMLCVGAYQSLSIKQLLAGMYSELQVNTLSESLLDSIVSMITLASKVSLCDVIDWDGTVGFS